MKSAVILGSHGQDGRILNEQLIKQGYGTYGIDIGDEEVDICNKQSIKDFISRIRPDEVFHLAAFHHSAEEELNENPEFQKKSHAINVSSVENFLEAIKNYSPVTKFFYASSSHIFGEPKTEIQNEETPKAPTTTYGKNKAEAMKVCDHYRNFHNIFACTGIFYTHESCYRNEKFLSQKVIQSAINKKTISIGDLNAVVDWGYAPEYTKAVQCIMQTMAPEDFIISTGHKMRVQEFIEAVFTECNLKWQDYVQENKGILKRQSTTRIGDPTKIKIATGWKAKTFGPALAKILLQTTKELKDK